MYNDLTAGSGGVYHNFTASSILGVNVSGIGLYVKCVSCVGFQIIQTVPVEAFTIPQDC